MLDEITVSINGTNYGGWKSASVYSSLESLCGMFELNVMDKWSEMGAVTQIRPGDECQVFAGGDLTITGYVDDVLPGINKDDHSIDIRGRDKTCDLVDCSAEVESFEVLGITLDVLANMICGKYGIGVQVKTDVGKPFEKFSVQPGESSFSCLEKAAKQRGVLLTTDGAGNLVLSARGDFPASGDALIEGENLKVGAAAHSYKDRYRDYKVNGQTPSFYDGETDPVHNQIGEARDVNIMRYRPLLLPAEFWTLPDAAKTRAENECALRAGRGTRANIQVTGWRQSNGELWRPGLKTAVKSERLYLDNVEMVVNSVRFSKSDSSGTIAELELIRPDAYLDSGAGQVQEDPFG